jgi:hypothetical protein
MTDDEIRDVFAELHRVGVDFGQPPGLALGTGFREGELLGWLRELPDALGHDAFAERLTARVDSAQPNAGSRLPRQPDGRPHRLWPTVEQLHAAIDVLVTEWDPLGARLGELPRDAVTHHAQNMLGIILNGGDPDRMERLIAGQLGAVEQEVFEVRPSPRAQRRYLARRLIQVVVDQPGPVHEEDPFSVADRAAQASLELARAEGRARETHTATGGSTTICFGPRGDEPPARDDGAACDECGAIGTVAFVGREVEPRYSRYCPSCWRKVRDKYWDWHLDARQFANPTDQSTPEEIIAAFDRIGEMFLRARERVCVVGTALWEDRGPLIERQLGRSEGESEADHDRRLRQLATQVVGQAPTMHGAMPSGIEELIRRYSPDASPPASANDRYEPPAARPAGHA